MKSAALRPQLSAPTDDWPLVRFYDEAPPDARLMYAVVAAEH